MQVWLNWQTADTICPLGPSRVAAAVAMAPGSVLSKAGLGSVATRSAQFRACSSLYRISLIVDVWVAGSLGLPGLGSTAQGLSPLEQQLLAAQLRQAAQQPAQQVHACTVPRVTRASSTWRQLSGVQACLQLKGLCCTTSCWLQQQEVAHRSALTRLCVHVQQQVNDLANQLRMASLQQQQQQRLRPQPFPPPGQYASQAPFLSPGQLPGQYPGSSQHLPQLPGQVPGQLPGYASYADLELQRQLQRQQQQQQQQLARQLQPPPPLPHYPGEQGESC